MILLPKIQPLSKPEKPDTATIAFWKKLSHLMLGKIG